MGEEGDDGCASAVSIEASLSAIQLEQIAEAALNLAVCIEGRLCFKFDIYLGIRRSLIFLALATELALVALEYSGYEGELTEYVTEYTV